MAKSSNRTWVGKSGRRRTFRLLLRRGICTFKSEFAAFAGVLYYCLLLEVLATSPASHYTTIFSVYVKMFLEIRDLFEAFFAPENWASVGFLSGVCAHMIKQALDSFEELATPRLIARVVSHCLWYLVAIARHRVVDLSLKSELAKKWRFRHGMSQAYLL